MSADAHRRSHILNWLCSDDYSRRFKNHSATCLEGTGKWFLEDPKLLNWVHDDGSSNLICLGGPGSGKTIMSTLVVNHLRNALELQKPVIYFFFDYQRHTEQTLEHFVVTLLRQLACLSREVFNAVEKLYEKLAPQSRRPTLDDLQSELRSAFKRIEDVSVIVDAWDECEVLLRKECADILHDCSLQCVVRLLVTTRDNHEVQALFAGDPILKIQASVQDLELYTTKRATELREHIKKDEVLVKNVIARVVDASDGV